MPQSADRPKPATSKRHNWLLQDLRCHAPSPLVSPSSAGNGCPRKLVQGSVQGSIPLMLHIQRLVAPAAHADLSWQPCDSGKSPFLPRDQHREGATQGTAHAAQFRTPKRHRWLHGAPLCTWEWTLGRPEHERWLSTVREFQAQTACGECTSSSPAQALPPASNISQINLTTRTTSTRLLATAVKFSAEYSRASHRA